MPRSAFLRRIQFPCKQLQREGIFLPVVESRCRHNRLATNEDGRTIETSLEEEPDVKIKLSYRVFKDGKERPLAGGYTIYSFVNSYLKPVEVPEAFLACARRYAGQVLEDWTCFDFMDTLRPATLTWPWISPVCADMPAPG